MGLISGKGSFYKDTLQISIEFAHANEFIDGIAHCEKCGFMATRAVGGEILKCKNKDCGATVPASTKTRYEQQQSTQESVRNVIAPFITNNTKIQVNVTGNKSLTMLILNFRDEPHLFASIEANFPTGRDYSSFRMPEWVWTLGYASSLEFLNGVLDATGYANAGSWTPRDGKSGTGRMRLYLQVVRNWGIVADYDSYIRDHLEKPVQTVDWGHPNIRDSKLQDYHAMSHTAWAREHQIKFFPEYFEDCQFRLTHKQALFQELLAHNKSCNFADDTGWFPPRTIAESKRKAKHPGEDDPRLPKPVRQHFDAFWQINLALGSLGLERLAASAASPEVFALTGDPTLEADHEELRLTLEKKWVYLASTLPTVRAASRAAKPIRKAGGSLEKDTYAPLVDLLSEELRKEFACEPYVFDTSSGNLNSFIARLDDNQLGELDFCNTFNIRPDVVGFVPGVREAFFIESKIELLNLRHLGQLIGYCAVALPKRAILISTEPVSESLARTILSKPSVLEYAPGKRIEIAQLIGNNIDYWKVQA
jgi:hypothetical protein